MTSEENNLSLETASQNLIAQNLIKPKLNRLLSFEYGQEMEKRPLNKKDKSCQTFANYIRQSGYSASLKDKKDLENENRLENIKELLSAMKEFDNLESFLEHVSLATHRSTMGR